MINLEGVKSITSDDWDGEILNLSRATFDRFKNDKALDVIGVYIIYTDHYDRDRNG